MFGHLCSDHPQGFPLSEQKLEGNTYIRQEIDEEGDVIYIEANGGAVKCTGRSDAAATEFGLEVIVFY